MVEFPHERALLEAVRSRLDEWVFEARERAYEDLFEGPDPRLSESELRQLDALDSRLTREEGRGLWGEDSYGIVQTGTMDEESTPQVVCTNHPQIPAFNYPGEDSIDEATRTALNEALWEYGERVVDYVQHDLEEFVWSAEVATWNE